MLTSVAMNGEIPNFVHPNRNAKKALAYQIQPSMNAIARSPTRTANAKMIQSVVKIRLATISRCSASKYADPVNQMPIAPPPQMANPSCVVLKKAATIAFVQPIVFRTISTIHQWCRDAQCGRLYPK
jgi:hypothetical protein